MAYTYTFMGTHYGAPLKSWNQSFVTGATITLLDAVLVNGYGSQIPTSVTLSNSTVTVVLPLDHGFVGTEVINISGCNESEFNGTFPITGVPNSTSYTYTITPGSNTSATGTITSKVAPAGWTKSFSGTNKAVYRMPGGSQRYLRVDDSFSQTYCDVRLYDTMSDVDTGTLCTPTFAQRASGQWTLPRDAATGSSQVIWDIIVDSSSLCIMFASASNAAINKNISFFVFGDLTNLTNPTDTYTTIIHAGLAGANGYTNGAGVYYASTFTGAGDPAESYSRTYIMKDSLGNTSVPVFTTCTSFTKPTFASYNTTALDFPTAYGYVHFIPIKVGDPKMIRGWLPNCFHTLHSPRCFATRDIISQGNKRYMAVNIHNTEQILFDISNNK